MGTCLGMKYLTGISVLMEMHIKWPPEKRYQNSSAHTNSTGIEKNGEFQTLHNEQLELMWTRGDNYSHYLNEPENLNFHLFVIITS